MSRITIDVRRSDGEVTRLRGRAGLAVSIQGIDLEAPLSELDPGLVSIRCDNEAQVALCLASILVAVQANAPGAVPMAVKMAGIMDARRPELRRELPPDSGEPPARRGRR